MHEFIVAHAQGYLFGYEYHGYASKIVQLVEEFFEQVCYYFCKQTFLTVWMINLILRE